MRWLRYSVLALDERRCINLMKYCPECGTRLEERWISTDARERLVCVACDAIRFTLLPERSRFPESKKNTRCGSIPRGGSSRTSLKPGRNVYMSGSGGGMSTQTCLPAERNASAKARLQPRVSPSASLCPKIRISWLPSMRSLISSYSCRALVFAVAMSFPPRCREEPL